MPPPFETDMNIVFDNETHHIVFHYGQSSLTALYQDLEIDAESLLSITRSSFIKRSSYIKSEEPKVHFKWRDADAEECWLDITVATNQDCRQLIAKMKALTSFSEVLVAK